ncbi:MAG: hypothetical protein U5R06_05250 [candidate division KSB1 bacterium]|nr:hypothetical protein [candidate division KSB1 bacterium]
MVDLYQDMPVSIYFILREPPEDERINAKELLRFPTLEPKPAFRALQHVTCLFNQDLNQTHDLESNIQVIDTGFFYGIRGEYPESFGVPYANAKAPTPVELFSIEGKSGQAVVYWLPWRMQEIISPAKINLKLHTTIKEPELVDMLTGTL